MRVQTLQVQRQGSVGGGVAGIGERGVLVVVRGLVMVGAVLGLFWRQAANGGGLTC